MSGPGPAGIDVKEVGSGDDFVVFVHGVLDRGRSFERVAELLASECRMLTYDRRGYGSSVAPGGPVGVDRHVADLLDVLDGRRAVVVGHSFGGIPALGAAAAAPGSVGALVLYETGLAWAPGWDDHVMQGVLGAPDAEDAGLRMILGERYDTMSDDRRARHRLDARAFIAEERSVRGATPPFDIADVRAPVVYGHSDEFPVMSSVVDELRNKVRRVEAIIVPGAGHHAHRSAPGSAVPGRAGRPPRPAPPTGASGRPRNQIATSESPSHLGRRITDRSRSGS